MGITGQFENKNYIEVRDSILTACKRHGKVAGIHVVQPDINELKARYDEGYRIIAYSLDITMIQAASENALRQIKKFNIQN